MTNLFIPYSGDKPASVDINGHRLLILSTSKDILEGALDMLGGDHIEELEVAGTPEAHQNIINSLAQSSNSGVVIAPGDVEMSLLLRNLEAELPWIQ